MAVASVDIAFLTVNYNTLDLVRKLAAFFDAVAVPFTFSLTVVDNNSSDGSQEFLASCPHLHSIQTGTNLGYGRAINRGVAATDSKYICVTNTDVILNTEALTALWHFMETHPGTAVCAPRIVYADGRDQGMVFRASLLAHYADGYGKLLAARAKSKIAHATAPVRVDGVMGAFFLVRRSAIPSPALFDEDFFFFYEDSALSHTLKNSAAPCFVLPGVSIVHLGGKSRSEASVSLFYKSKYLYLMKFYGRIHSRAVRLLDLFRTFRKWLLYSVLRWVVPSDRIKSKQTHYKIALKTIRALRIE
jgi:N-acetylglucosaminyl-diphospho-decaprenol L-rhamnosyltransferase